METSELVKNIKRSFRLYMNGATAASMRQKGLEYKVNWGVSQMDLRHMAGLYGKDKSLAMALWAERSVRECRLLATLVMPASELSKGEALEWATSATTVELMEAVVFNLLQYVEDAGSLARQMLNSDALLLHMGAYNLVCRLLRRNKDIEPHVYSAIFDAASSDFKSILDIGHPANIQKGNRQLLHAIVNCLGYIASLDGQQSVRAERLLSEAGLGI